MNVLYICEDRGIAVLGGKGASIHVRSITEAMERIGHHVTLAAARVAGSERPPRVTNLIELPTGDGARESLLRDLARGADVALERLSLGAEAGERAAHAAGIPHVLEVNAPLVAEAARHRGLADVDGMLARETALIERTDLALAISQPLVEQLRERAPATTVVLVRNGVEPFRAANLRDRTRARLGIADDEIAILFTGSMKPWHGVIELLVAYEQIGDGDRGTHLILAGHGPLADVVRTMADESVHTDRIHMLGHVPHDDVPALLAAGDIAAAPYLDEPGFYFCPLKVLEYLSAGLPTVYSDLGDIRAIVGDGGIGTAPGDPVTLARDLMRLVDRADVRSALATNAPGRVAHQTWDHVAVAITVHIARTIRRAGSQARA